MVYVIMSYPASGSGTLTYPDDFFHEGYVTSEEKARKICYEKNKKACEEEGFDFDENINPEDVLLDSESGCQVWTYVPVSKLK